MDGVLIAASPNGGDIKLVDNRMKVSSLQTPYAGGLSVTCALEKKLLCGLAKSAAIRLMDMNGSEVSAFLGHTDTPIHLSPISDQLFVSAGDDRAIKLWDVRQRVPIGHFGTNQSVLSLTATEQFITFCFHDRHIGVIDIKTSPAQSVLGFSMEEHVATNMCYYPANDTLFLFATAAKEGNSDSLLFMHHDGSSRKYLFRKYPNFLRM
jgi:WD40 repeat protein